VPITEANGRRLLLQRSASSITAETVTGLKEKKMNSILKTTPFGDNQWPFSL
jgi:hypothetical protein